MNKCMFCGAELTTADYGGVCVSCRNSGFGNIHIQPMSPFGPSFPPPEYPPYTPPAQYGWVCPRCGAVHAPFIPHCHCTPPTRTTDGTQLNINFDE